MVEPIDIRTGLPFASRRQHLHHPPSDGASLGGRSGRARGLLGGCFIGCMMAQQGGGAWVNPYKTDGLIAMWDGEWNAGGGVHDQSATTWTNIVANNEIGDMPVSDSYFTWGDKYIENLAKKGINKAFPSAQWYIDAFSQNGATLEVVFRFHGLLDDITATSQNEHFTFTIGQLVFHKAYSKQLLAFGNTNAYQGWGNSTFGTKYLSNVVFDDVIMQASQSIDLTNNQTRYGRNGNLSTIAGAGIMGVQYFAYNRNNISILSGSMGTSDGAASVGSRVYCARLYNRPLTQVEQLANYSVDKERFGLP